MTQNFIGNIFQPITNLIQQYKRDRRNQKAWSEIYALEHAGQYAEAAAIYLRLAEEDLNYNKLIYGMNMHGAFKLWLKAQNVETAMDLARQTLSVLSNSLTSSKALEELSQMVGELYVAGYAAEADAFSQELNAQLAKHGLPSATIPEAVFKNSKFPTTCPQCGGQLPRAVGGNELKCTYCGCVVRAE